MKTYGQFCGLARALDHVGDRWTMLIVRELLIDDTTYGELLSALEGVPTNLLADRLRQLEDDGLLTRHADPDDRRRVRYQLTELGRGLEPALLALIRWGAHWMGTGPAGDRFEPKWAMLAVRALLSDRAPTVEGTIALRFDDEPVTVESRAGAVHVRRGAPASEEVSVEGTSAVVLGLVSGQMSMAAATRSGLRMRGDRTLARAVLVPGRTAGDLSVLVTRSHPMG